MLCFFFFLKLLNASCRGVVLVAITHTIGLPSLSQASVIRHKGKEPGMSWMMSELLPIKLKYSRC